MNMSKRSIKRYVLKVVRVFQTPDEIIEKIEKDNKVSIITVRPDVIEGKKRRQISIQDNISLVESNGDLFLSIGYSYKKLVSVKTQKDKI